MRKRTTKLLSTLLALCMALALLPGTALAAQSSGKCGDGLTWSFRDGRLAVQGTGAMEDYGYSAVPWASFRDQITSVVVYDGVSRLGNNAFAGCGSLSEVTIPDSVTSFGGNVFYRCTSLAAVDIPGGVTSIGDLAFTGCASLTGVTIPDGVTSIASRLFADCTSLTAVAIPNRVASIGDGAFAGCTALTGLTIPGGVTSIGANAFEGCTSLIGLALPSGITSIGASTFAGCSALTGITIPGKVSSIGESAFARCTSLSSITIPGGVASIEESTFAGCTALTGITIPDSVTSIASRAFENCTSLSDVYYGGSDPQWKKISINNVNSVNAQLLGANIHCNSTGISVTVGGSAVVWTDASPFIDANSRTMVPLRAVADAMSLNVSWDGAAREAVFTDGSKTIIFPIDSTSARTGDGVPVQMDTAAVIVSERTYAPIRYLAEFFGYTVGWNAETKTVSIA